MHTKQWTLTLAISLLLAQTGCGKQQSAAEAPMAAAEEKMAAAGEAVVMQDAAMPAAAPPARSAESPKTHLSEIDTTTGVAAAQVSSSAATYEDGQRKFIRTANTEFRVKDVYQSALAIEDAVAAQGGFVVRNQISAQTESVQRRPAGDGKLIELAEYTVRGSLTVRVPSEHTQTLLREIAKQMDFMDQRSFEAMDAQFQMLRRRLEFERSQQAQQALGDVVPMATGWTVRPMSSQRVTTPRPPATKP